MTGSAGSPASSLAVPCAGSSPPEDPAPEALVPQADRTRANAASEAREPRWRVRRRRDVLSESDDEWAGVMAGGSDGFMAVTLNVIANQLQLGGMRAGSEAPEELTRG
ncbi:hypothetical protein GCM10025784_29900 [Citricoccus nitrophenolicus]